MNDKAGNDAAGNYAGVIDIHNHAIPAGFVDRVRTEGSRYGYSIVEPSEDVAGRAHVDSYGKDGEREGDAMIVASDGTSYDLRPRRTDEEVRLRELADAGIHVVVESVTPKVMNYRESEAAARWSARAVNDAFGEVMRAYPGRVFASANVPLHLPALAADELERAVTAHGMRSVQIGSNVNGENLDDPALDRFWQRAEALGVLVIVHGQAQSTAARERLGRYDLLNLIGTPLEDAIACASVIFGGVLERHSALRICFVHAGGYAPWIRGRWRRGLEVRPSARARVSSAFDDLFSRVYFDTLIHDALALQYLVAAVGADRLMLGTDYAANMGSWTEQIAMINGLEDVSAADKRAMLGGTARRVLALD
jgi:aminocarboxymuconate-semialdehyde decarboxylase